MLLEENSSGRQYKIQKELKEKLEELVEGEEEEGEKEIKNIGHIL